MEHAASCRPSHDPTVQPHQTAADSGLDIPIPWSGLAAKQTLLRGNGCKWLICEEVGKGSSLGEKPLKDGVVTGAAWGPVPENTPQDCPTEGSRSRGSPLEVAMPLILANSFGSRKSPQAEKSKRPQAPGKSMHDAPFLQRLLCHLPAQLLAESACGAFPAISTHFLRCNR